MGTHLRVLSESYLMNTMMDLDAHKNSLHPCGLDESSLTIGFLNGMKSTFESREVL